MKASISRRRALAVLTLPALAGPPAWADSWPSKPVRLIVAYPPGGVSDIVARALGEKLAKQIGKPVLVENKAGASGVIGLDAVAKAPPDGYTFGFAAISPLTLSPHFGKLPFDPDLDIDPVAGVMYSPVLLLATPASRAQGFRDMMGAAKDRPRATRWATSGQASIGHLILAQLQAAAKVEFTHVPYKGGAQPINDALGGHFELLTTNASSTVTQYIEQGKLRPLAVAAEKRLPSLPTTPTLLELGYPRANITSQFAIFAPANVPKAISDRFSREVNEILRDPQLRQTLLANDNVPTGGSAVELKKIIADEYSNNGSVIKAFGIKAAQEQ